MKLKKIVLIFFAILLLYAANIGVSLMFLPSVSGLAERKASMTIQVKDWKGNYHPFIVGPKNRYWTPSKRIPPEMKWAVIAAEDENFYRHEGIDVKAIKEAIKYDLEKKKLARGASTITQQTAKNLFLSRDKSLSRKIKELILAKRMEEELTKGRILELYLNVVELGPMVYGIGHGARYYFGKPPSSLTPRECAFLTAMLPGPRIAYNPYRNLRKVLKRSGMVLRLLRAKRVLSNDEYRQAILEEPNIAGMQRKVEVSIAKEEAIQTQMSSAVPSPDIEPPIADGADGATGEEGPLPGTPPETEGNPPPDNAPENPPAPAAGTE